MTNDNLLAYHQVARVQQQIQQHSSRVIFKEWHPQQETELTWAQASERLSRLAWGLLGQGVAVQDKIAIYADNCINWTLTDLAISHLRAVSVPIYATSTASQAAFIVNDAAVRILFVGGQAQMDEALSMLGVCPQLQRIVVFDPHVDLRGCTQACHISTFEQMADASHDQQLQQRINQRELDDLFTLIYTSGTTGEPKGVMLDYRNLAVQLQLHDQRLALSTEDISLCFLPLAHVFERAWTFYVMHCGAQNVYLSDTNLVREAMQVVQPTVMCAVPRFYEKVFSAIHEKVAQAPWYRKGLFRGAIWCGKQMFQATIKQKSPSASIKILFAVADKLVLSKLRALLGGRIRFMPAAGAKLDDNIILFFQSVGINIKYGYGMTETCATVSCWEEQAFRFGSIGKPLPGIEVRIAEQNEIQVRGPTVMRGYFNRPLETEQAFTPDGWLRTGDAGSLDKQGNLFFTERLKEMMKTSGGKYIAPQKIEGTLAQDRYIEQIAIIADERNFVSALIVPCFDTLEEYAKSINLNHHNLVGLLCNKQIISLFEQRLKEMQKGLARFEQVKKFTLLPSPFSMESGELTPTLKLRRTVIQQRYQHEINLMYRD